MSVCFPPPPFLQKIITNLPRWNGAAFSVDALQKIVQRGRKRQFPQLAPAKTNSLTSERGVLLEWICLPALLLSEPNRKASEGDEGGIGEGRPREALALPDARSQTERRQKEEPAGSGAPRLLDSSLFATPFTWWQIYFVTKLQSRTKLSLLWLLDPYRLPGEQLNEQNSGRGGEGKKKSHLLGKTKTKRNTQATSL